MASIPGTTLWIPPAFYNQMMYYVWKVDAEVGGCGTLEFNTPEENDIYVTEIFLDKQKVHGTECTLSSDGSTYEKLINSGEIDKACKLQLWWHSHYTMGVTHSGIDDKTMREWSGDYVVALVINRSGEMKAKLMTKIPVMVVGDIDVKVNWFDVPNNEDLGAEVAEKVTKEVVTYGKCQAIVPYANYQHNQDGKWEPRKDEYDGTPLHRMTDAEWEEMEEEYYSDVEDEKLGFPVGEMDAFEKKALRNMWEAND
jgi:hypothetical protein